MIGTWSRRPPRPDPASRGGAISTVIVKTWTRPGVAGWFVVMKMRRLELRAGATKQHDNKAGPRRDYWIKEIRHRELELVANAEASSARMVEACRDKPPKPQQT